MSQEHDPEFEGRAEEFLTLFRKGADFTKELIAENERLRRQLASIEHRQHAAAQSDDEWDKLRSELLVRIQSLEDEKRDALERLQSVSSLQYM